MAGHLPKSPTEFRKIPGARIGILASMWHSECVERMVQRAIGELESVGVAKGAIEVHRVPGSLELPMAARVLFESRPELDAIIAFGVVLKGDTTHDSTVLQQVNMGFSLVADRFGKSIINEVIGVSKIEDAVRRSGDDLSNKGVEAVFAVSEFLAWKRELEGR